MTNDKISSSRRGFIKGMAAGAGMVTASAAGIVHAAGQAPAQAQNAVSEFSGIPLHKQVWDFEKKPDPIPDSQIKDVWDCDILIIGSGASGMPASVAAVETGKKVITIEKLTKDQVFGNKDRPDLSRAIGAWFGFPKHRLLEKYGYKKNFQAELNDIYRQGHWRVDQRQAQAMLRYSPTVSDWWLEKLASQGVNIDKLPIENNGERREAELPEVPWKRPGTYVYWHGGEIICPAGIAEKALEGWLNENDFQITYGTPAKQLLMDKDGRCVGAIAKNDKGYVKINAKSVILCTGGYEGNREMMLKYLPESEAYREVFGKKTNTGDGYLMAQWVGARMDPWPHCSMSWDGMSPEGLKMGFDYVGVARQAWLYVNAYGKRFMNEDAPFAGVARAMYIQPKSMMWTIFDENWRDPDVVDKLKGTVCRRMTTKHVPFILPMNTIKNTEKMIEGGVILKADTLPELFKKMRAEGPKLGIGADFTDEDIMATINRYNELCAKGVDEDFGKDANCLVPIGKPPYYACRTTVGILVTQAGPLVDDHYRVYDQDNKPIEGLFACGNVAGGFNAYEFCMNADIGSLGRCAISGYVAAKTAAGEKV
jgi:fumarate reductase flavoprotein subunit